MDLRKLSTTRVEVFQVAISKLSTGFLDDLRICSLEAERHDLFKEDLVEQGARRRYFIPERIVNKYGEVGGITGRWAHGRNSSLDNYVWKKRVEYLVEKPGECKCETCGAVFLW
jgi:hypothetical protein